MNEPYNVKDKITGALFSARNMLNALSVITKIYSPVIVALPGRGWSGGACGGADIQPSRRWRADWYQGAVHHATATRLDATVQDGVAEALDVARQVSKHPHAPKK